MLSCIQRAARPQIPLGGVSVCERLRSAASSGGELDTVGVETSFTSLLQIFPATRRTVEKYQSRPQLEKSFVPSQQPVVAVMQNGKLRLVAERFHQLEPILERRE